jgi:flagellar hook assembly protein FlgD
VTLYQNFPNPFNPSTTIAFKLPARRDVFLSVYNAEGSLIKNLVNGSMAEGLQEVTWDGKNEQGTPVGSGVYFYQLTFENQTLTKKMVLIK